MVEQADHTITHLTADLVSAFVANNQVRAIELPELIAAVHTALTTLSVPKDVAAPAPVLTPAVSIKKSVTDDFLICLEDGKKFKSLRRHLLTAFGMTPDDYRAKWNLPRDYPMVAPAYAAKRSELAKATGLGSSRKTVAAEVKAPVATPANDAVPPKRAAAKRSEASADVAAETLQETTAKRRGRPKKAA